MPEPVTTTSISVAIQFVRATSARATYIYGRARDGGFYPAGAYVLKNQGEFFAMTASVDLHGRLTREPFTRDELRRKQPTYYRYLTRLFGPAGA